MDFGRDALVAGFLKVIGSRPAAKGVSIYQKSATEIGFAIDGVTVGGIKGGTNALVAAPRNQHTGGTPVKASTDGTDSTPVVTETYINEIELPSGPMTGFAMFQGTVAAGNVFAILYDKSGVVIAQSLSTAIVGVDAFFRIPWVSAPVLVGGTFYIGLQFNNVANRFNTHPIGNFGAGKKTGEVFGTPTSIAALPPPTTFTAGQGPMGSAY